MKTQTEDNAVIKGGYRAPLTTTLILRHSASAMQYRSGDGYPTEAEEIDLE